MKKTVSEKNGTVVTLLYNYFKTTIEQQNTK